MEAICKEATHWYPLHLSGKTCSFNGRASTDKSPAARSLRLSVQESHPLARRGEQQWQMETFKIKKACSFLVFRPRRCRQKTHSVFRHLN